MSRGQRLALACLTSLAAIVYASPVTAATLFDPALKFRVVRTEHFRIYFHQGQDRASARLAAIAETTWQRLRGPLGGRMPALTHVVLANQSDLPNGYATPLPYNTIVIYPASPAGSEFATDDWLRLVFTHEFTHIVHLDRSEHWARVWRGMFGRTLLAFPNMFLPTWQIEGLATFEESTITGEGRLHAGDFRVIVDEAARTNKLLPIDRVNGGLTDWPSGQGPYAYGVGFHQYLADRFGQASLAQLADATARRVPYTQPAVFERIFGQSLKSLWREYEASLVAQAAPPAMDPNVTQITRHGFVAAAPRFDRYGGGIVYARRTPDGFPTLSRVDRNGGEPTTLTTRYFGSTTGIGREHLYFDQLEIRRNVALTGDLYALSRADGRVHAITRDAGLHDPDLSPDESTIVAVQEHGGSRTLVLVRVADGSITKLAGDDQTQFDAPRWSPDGQSVAVSRHRFEADPEVVVVDAKTGRIGTVFGSANTRIVMPAWRPDGRALVAALSQGDDPFNLFEFALDGSGSVRRLTDTHGGATWPDVSQDGATLLFVGYTTRGYDLFSMPYPTGRPVARLVGEAPKAAEPNDANAIANTLSNYSPVQTLKPTSWEPIFVFDRDQARLGASTSGRDVLGYHSYAASASWLVASPSEAPKPRSAAPDWFAFYAYDRWRPRLFVAASSETSFFAGPATDLGTPSASTRRRRQIETGVALPFLHARTSHSVLGTLFRSVDDISLPSGPLSRERTAMRAAWRTQTARTYGYSISPEGGITGGVTTEFVRRALGASDDATILTGDVRAYLPGLQPHHVVAVRVAGGRSTGAQNVGRTFVLGGAGPDASVTDFGSGAISLLRGFGGSSFAGSHVALVNADYRWPLARPQRGVGMWPIFLHTLHAAAFVDAGHAWTRTFDADALKTSIGAELSANLVAGFYFPFTMTVGAAWGHDGSGTLSSGMTAYLRVGKAF